MLQQQMDGTTKPIRYLSRSLPDAGQEYDTTHREFLTIGLALLSLRPYLEGIKLTIKIDYDSLKWILIHTESTGRLAGWCLCLSEFEFDAVHRADVMHQPADQRLRLHANVEDNTPLVDDIALLAIDTMRNLGDDLIIVIDTIKDDFIPLEKDTTEVSLDTSRTKNGFLMKQA